MRIISFKATDEISKHLDTKANKSEYLRRLIYDDMNSTHITETRLRQIIGEFVGHCKPEYREDISNEIDSILNM